ncbi:MAG: serine acetyltransferase [Phycisphaerales bacterium]|nr:serine acetyltransferase [Phycisphaerales bacterium]
MNGKKLFAHLPRIINTLTDSIVSDERLRHLNQVNLPDRERIIQAIGLLRQLLFPGYFGQPGLTSDNLHQRLSQLVQSVAEVLYEQVSCCLRYRKNIAADSTQTANGDDCNDQACQIVVQFLDRLPAVRQLLALDVRAAFDGDPAAHNVDETIYCYPGLFTISVQRLAHELFKLDVPLLPRIITEYAHSLTGIDIHPGAQLGERLFIDHGTGVVIGETTRIGMNVKIYQGVTLGALAPAYGQMLRGTKRHPTIEDDVTIYAGATILGGDTVIGKGCVIGGNVFITASVPPHTQVTQEPGRLHYRERGKRKKGDEPLVLDFQI